MKIDVYTKIVLTIIAACLVLLVLKAYNVVTPAYAADVVDVRIRGIDEAGHLRWEDLPVKINNWNEMPQR